MELEKNSKFKIYLVILIFIMIILLSAYVVISKIVNHDTILDYDTIDTVEKFNNTLLEENNKFTEISIKDNDVIELYERINNIDMEEKLYLMKNLQFDWAKESSVVLSSLNENLITYEDGKKYVSADVFDMKYNELFGNYKIGLEKESNECDTVSFDITTNKYLLNEPCLENDLQMKTFFKNVTYNESRAEIIINKYYAFMKPTTRINFYPEDEGIDLFTENDLKQIIVSDIQKEDINNYIHKMNTISYVFKKNTNGNYYLNSVK